MNSVKLDTTIPNRKLRLSVYFHKQRKQFYASCHPVTIEEISEVSLSTEMGNWLFLESAARDSKKKSESLLANWKNNPIAEFVQKTADKFNLVLV